MLLNYGSFLLQMKNKKDVCIFFFIIIEKKNIIKIYIVLFLNQSIFFLQRSIR